MSKPFLMLTLACLWPLLLFTPVPSLIPLLFPHFCPFYNQKSNLTPEELALENEPWYKFFAELEFGRPVSGV